MAELLSQLVLDLHILRIVLESFSMLSMKNIEILQKIK